DDRRDAAAEAGGVAQVDGSRRLGVIATLHAGRLRSRGRIRVARRRGTGAANGQVLRAGPAVRAAALDRQPATLGGATDVDLLVPRQDGEHRVAATRRRTEVANC